MLSFKATLVTLLHLLLLLAGVLFVDYAFGSSVHSSYECLNQRTRNLKQK